jgi:hypothetical protein
VLGKDEGWRHSPFLEVAKTAVRRIRQSQNCQSEIMDADIAPLKPLKRLGH